MVTFELTEQDKTDNRWGGVGWIVDSKKKKKLIPICRVYYIMGGTVHDGLQNTIH